MSLTELTGVFSCGTLSLLGSLSSREASCGIFSAQLYLLLTLRQTPRAGDGKERRTRQARAREMLRALPFSPIQRTSWTIRTRCEGTKGKAAGQMRNSLLRKQRNRGALQEQVSPEFSSMICIAQF